MAVIRFGRTGEILPAASGQFKAVAHNPFSSMTCKYAGLHRDFML
jgi:hypothetical protein